MRKFVINLDEDVGRLKSFLLSNSHVSAVERFSGFVGSKLNRTALLAEGYIAPDLAYKDGTLGVARSHIAIWEMTARTGEPCLIAEDDAIFARNFDEIAWRLLEVDPNWEIITWGFNYDSYVWVEIPDGIARARLFVNQDDLRRNLEKWSTLDVKPALIRLKHQFGLCGYSVGPKGAEKLLQHCLPIRKGFISFPDVGVSVENKIFDCTVKPGASENECLRLHSTADSYAK
jgi:glycosyl transferase, family 25